MRQPCGAGLPAGPVRQGDALLDQHRSDIPVIGKSQVGQRSAKAVLVPPLDGPGRRVKDGRDLHDGEAKGCEPALRDSEKRVAFCATPYRQPSRISETAIRQRRQELGFERLQIAAAENVGVDAQPLEGRVQREKLLCAEVHLEQDPRLSEEVKQHLHL